MIKEKKKNKNREITLKDEISGYIKTAGVTFLIASAFTVLLSFHARSEMIKNIYAHKEEKGRLDTKIAQKIVAQSDFTKLLHQRSYNICMQVAALYESAEDYPKAEYAYSLAYNKAPENNYVVHYKYARVLITQEKFDEAQKIIDSAVDTNNLKLIKFKTRAYIVMGDKYNSIDKFLKAALCYEKAQYYYNCLKKKDKKVEQAIKERLSDAYVDVADVMVENGYNSDAVQYLKKALKNTPDKFVVKYKLAIIYADLDPVVSVDYFNYLLDKMPQYIDYNVYNRALMKAANIAEIQGDLTKSKYYRYRSHSVDLFLNQKVVYKDDIEVLLEKFTVKKVLFKYKLEADFKLENESSVDIKRLFVQFVLRHKDKETEMYTEQCATKKLPLYSNGGKSETIKVKFGNNIFTKKELKNYYIDVYLYKDKKYKTLMGTFRVPLK